MSSMAEMSEIGDFQGLESLGAKKKAQKCPPQYKRVKHPQQGFVCIPKSPCRPGYKFNAKKFSCIATPKLKRQLTAGGGGGGGGGTLPMFTGGGIDPTTGLPAASGFTIDPTTGLPAPYPSLDPSAGLEIPGGIPTDIFAPTPFPGSPYPGAVTPYPPGLPGSACAAGLVQNAYTGQCEQIFPAGGAGTGSSALYPFGTPGATTPPQCPAGTVLNPMTGQCVNPLTGQSFGPPVGTQQPGLPFGGQPQGPSALYPFQQPSFQQPSFGGGFQQPSFGPGPSFDQVPVDTGDGGEDFMPDDVQMNLTPPGVPQSYQQPFSPQYQEEQTSQEIFDSGGTDQSAYEGMMGLGIDAKDIGDEFRKYRDIGFETAERVIQIGKKPVKPQAVNVTIAPEPTPAWQTPVAIGVGALLLFGLYKAFKRS